MLLPRDELLGLDRVLAGGQQHVERDQQLLVGAHAHRVLGPDAGQRLEHDRVADRAHEPPGVLGVGHPGLPRHGEAGLGQHLLHAVLVAEAAGHQRLDPLDPQHLTGAGQRQRQLLEVAQQPVDAPPLLLERPRREHQLVGVHRVRDAEVTGHALAQERGHPLLGLLRDDPQPGVLELGEHLQAMHHVRPEVGRDEHHVDRHAGLLRSGRMYRPTSRGPAPRMFSFLQGLRPALGYGSAP